MNIDEQCFPLGKELCNPFPLGENYGILSPQSPSEPIGKLQASNSAATGRNRPPQTAGDPGSRMRPAGCRSSSHRVLELGGSLQINIDGMHCIVPLPQDPWKAHGKFGRNPFRDWSADNCMAIIVCFSRPVSERISSRVNMAFVMVWAARNMAWVSSMLIIVTLMAPMAIFCCQ